MNCPVWFRPELRDVMWKGPIGNGKLVQAAFIICVAFATLVVSFIKARRCPSCTCRLATGD
jgi:hypothetical protein